MKIIILYATNSGGTYIAGEFIKDFFEKKNHKVDFLEVDKIDLSRIKSYDLLILGTNTWNYGNKEGQPHISYINMRASFEQTDFSTIQCAIYCLGDVSYSHFCGAANVLEEIITNSKGKLIVPPLKINGYLRDEIKNNRILSRWLQEILKEIQSLDNSNHNF